MNNLTIGGIDTRTNTPFAYYETIAGGMGARSNADGLSGVHTHMTNSLNTPAEALEYAYPLRVKRYSYRARSAGGDNTAAETDWSAKSNCWTMRRSRFLLTGDVLRLMGWPRRAGSNRDNQISPPGRSRCPAGKMQRQRFQRGRYPH